MGADICIEGSAGRTAQSEWRSVSEAASKAIANPLLDGVSMKGAKGVIVSITGGDDMRLLEVDEAANHIRELVETTKPRRKGHGRQQLPKHLPRDRRVYELSEAERLCHGCGQARVVIGQEVSEKLDYEPASLTVLRQAQTTAAAGRRTAGAAHDFNNLLTIILG